MIQEAGLKKINLIKTMISSFHDTVNTDQNDIHTISKQFNDLVHRYNESHDLIPTSYVLPPAAVAYKRNRTRLHVLLRQDGIFTRIKQSKVFKQMDEKFTFDYFLKIVDQNEYYYDIYGEQHDEIYNTNKITEYFQNVNLYGGEKDTYGQIPYLIWYNVISYIQFPDYDLYKVDRIYIYDIYKDACLYNNINHDYSNKLINVSGIFESLSGYINLPYFTQTNNISKYEILEKIYSVLDRENIN